MKTKNIIFLILISLLIYSCQQDESLQQGKVQFSFNASTQISGATGGRIQADDIPSGASLLISITKSNGDSVFSSKKIELLKIGDHFVSGPVSLLQGNYLITDFMVVSADNTTLFVTPKAGSPLAKDVTTPLPIPFTVGSNAVANVEVEVLSTVQKDPEDFGYASFAVNIVPNLAVAIFIIDKNGNTQFANADVYVVHGIDTVLTKKTDSGINILNWNAESGQNYTLTIVKDGYGTFRKDFSLFSLLSELKGKPLTVILKPAFFVRWTYDNNFLPTFTPRIVLGGMQYGFVEINWGDNTFGNNTFVKNYSDGFTQEIYHTYPTFGTYTTSVTGDLSTIQSLNISGRRAILDSISFENLSELERLFVAQLYFTRFDVTIDISNNPKLKILILSELTNNIVSLDIAKNPLLNYIDLHEDRMGSIDKLIDDLYASVVTLNKQNGFLDIHRDLSPGNHSGFIAPPSPAQLAKLNSLINDYSWTVHPLN